MSSRRRTLRHAASVVLAALPLAPFVIASPPDASCQGRSTSIVVRVRDHVLLACEDDRIRQKAKVSLGTGGVGKQRQGDRRTPLGVYELGDARPSERFGIFIPIGYPTSEQIRHGFTGGDVGIHGPTRPFRWAGPINARFDWTQGCIALATDEELEALRDWMVRSGCRIVTIE